MEGKVKRPTLKLKDGKKIKCVVENEDYYFYRVRRRETAEAVIEKLKSRGIEGTSIGELYSGNARFFVRVPIKKEEE